MGGGVKENYGRNIWIEFFKRKVPENDFYLVQDIYE